jgi:hypothetical protein
VTITIAPAPDSDDPADAPPALTFEERLGALYRKQEELSRRFDPESEKEYTRVVNEIARLTSQQDGQR